MPHLVPKIIVALPYVDRAPTPEERPDQRRIDWIKNGDCLGAAEHAADNSGELNRGPVQVQKNSTTLYENELIIDSSLKEIIERVNSHDDALGGIGDDNLAIKVSELEDAVAPLPVGILTNKQMIFLNTGETLKLKSVNGGRDPILDKTDRPIFDDLYYVKNQIGAWAGKDINGNIDETIVNPTGLIGRIVSQGLAINKNKNDITILEDEWRDSDVGKLKADIDQMRSELGETEKAPKPNMYLWSVVSDEKHVEFRKDIDALKLAVGDVVGDTLDVRITANKDKSEQNALAIVNTNDMVNNINTIIGDTTQPTTMVYNINQNSLDIGKLKGIVGEDVHSGLQAQVTSITNEFGTDDTPNTIKGRIKANETSITLTGNEVATLSTKVGNNAAGSETGLYRRVVDLEGSIIEDAPKDGDSYVRKDGAWVKYVQPQRTRGGYVVANNDSAIVLIASSTSKLTFDAAHAIQQQFNNNLEGDFTDSTLHLIKDDHLLNIKSKYSLSKGTEDATLALYLNEVQHGTPIKIAKAEWPTDNATIEIVFEEFIQFTAGDKLSLRASTVAAQSINIVNATINAFEI